LCPEPFSSSPPCFCAAPLAAQSRRVAVTVADSADFDLDRYRWRSRVVVLFAPSAGTPAYAEQRAALARRPTRYARAT
jgi:hypothetical protein